MQNTHALIVGIERYAAGDTWSRDGLGDDAVNFLEYLHRRDVPPAQIYTFLSLLPQNEERLLLRARPLCNSIEKPTSGQLNDFITKKLPGIQADLFIVYWVGHGMITLEGERCLFTADAEDRDKRNIDFNELLAALRTDRYPGLNRQAFVVDTCANYVHNSIASMPMTTYYHGNAIAGREQFALLAASPGEFARLSVTEKSAYLSHELMKILNAADALEAAWPPDLTKTVQQLKERFAEMRVNGETKQTPAFIWIHPWKGDQETLGTIDHFFSWSPLWISSFVGRKKEIAKLQELLRSHHLVTITGSGGCGKTRLALEVAREVRPEYPDGVWLVELEKLPPEPRRVKLSDSTLEQSRVPKAIASALKVPQVVGRPQMETLVDHFRDKKALLVVDNCEHAFNACGLAIHTLVRGCTDLRILATSREAFKGGEEQLYRVPSLSLPEPGVSINVADPQQPEAVELFVERAKSSRSDFVLTKQNAPAVLAICRRLDGIPLAIELAAAIVGEVSNVQTICDRLNESFAILGDQPDIIPRKRTLQATIDWSYKLLKNEERLLLQRLSTFAGGWTLKAAEAVCLDALLTKQNIWELHLALVRKSLVQEEDQYGDSRYRLLTTVQMYSNRKLKASGHFDEMRNRHMQWYISLAEASEESLFTPDQPAAANLLEAELGNFRAALEWSKVSQPETGWCLAGALWKFWVVHGHLHEGREQLMYWISCQRNLVSVETQAKVYVGAGVLAYLEGDFVQAAEKCTEGLKLSREARNSWLTGVSLTILGVFYQHGMNDNTKASQAFEEVLTLADEAKSLWLLGLALVNMGFHVYLPYVESRPKALEMLEKGLEIARTIGDEWLLSLALTKSGICACLAGKPRLAEQRCKESLKISFQRTNLREPFDIVQAVEGLIVAAFATGVTDDAKRGVILLGTVKAILSNAAVPPFLQNAHQESEQIGRTQLGDVAFEAALTIGSTMTPKEAIEYALTN